MWKYIKDHPESVILYPMLAIASLAALDFLFGLLICVIVMAITTELLHWPRWLSTVVGMIVLFVAMYAFQSMLGISHIAGGSDEQHCSSPGC